MASRTAPNNTVSPALLRERLVYCPETGTLTWNAKDVPASGLARRITTAWNSRYAGKAAFTFADGNGYRRGQVGGALLLAHRVAWAIVHGAWPAALLDHSDGDPSNNRLANLREVDHIGNARNTALRRTSSTGEIGVSFSRAAGRYWAQIGVGGSVLYLGLHDTIEEAAAARRAAEREHGFHPNHGRAA
jgi:hypothetical protein